MRREDCLNPLSLNDSPFERSCLNLILDLIDYVIFLTNFPEFFASSTLSSS